MAQLQNTWHNCKKKCKTSKKNHDSETYVSSLQKLPPASPCRCIADALINFESPATTQQPTTAQRQQKMAKHDKTRHVSSLQKLPAAPPCCCIADNASAASPLLLHNNQPLLINSSPPTMMVRGWTKAATKDLRDKITRGKINHKSQHPNRSVPWQRSARRAFPWL
jgi:hypothetical protein